MVRFSHQAKFSAFAFSSCHPESACQTGTLPSCSSGHPYGWGWRCSRPASWWPPPARSGSGSPRSRKAKDQTKRTISGLVKWLGSLLLILMYLKSTQLCLVIMDRFFLQLTWGSPWSEASLCRSSRAWLTFFSNCRAHCMASSPLPHSSRSGFYRRKTFNYNRLHSHYIKPCVHIAQWSESTVSTPLSPLSTMLCLLTGSED